MHLWPQFVHSPVAHCLGPLPGICSASFWVGIQNSEAGPAASVRTLVIPTANVSSGFAVKGQTVNA